MRLAVTLSWAVLVGMSGAAFATAPSQSIRPEARPLTLEAQTRSSGVRVYYQSTVRPKARPTTRQVIQISATREREDVTSGGSSRSTLATTIPVFRSPNPPRRPSNLNISGSSERTRSTGTRVASTDPTISGDVGPICGDRRIRGERLETITHATPGCGIENPVRVSSVDGVSLSQAAVMDCTTALALTTWVKRGVKPVFGRTGGGVATLQVASHYSCRTRNSKPGAKISEHGKGRAIDISAFLLKDGRSVTVLEGWKTAGQSNALKKLHRAACGPFGTVLGPNADQYHQDHFHFDTARYRSGSYCK